MMHFLPFAAKRAISTYATGPFLLIKMCLIELKKPNNGKKSNDSEETRCIFDNFWVIGSILKHKQQFLRMQHGHFQS